MNTRGLKNAVIGLILIGTNCQTNGTNTYCADGTTFHTYKNGSNSYIQDNRGNSWNVDKHGYTSGSGKNRGEWYNPRTGSWGGTGRSGIAPAVIPGLVDPE